MSRRVRLRDVTNVTMFGPADRLDPPQPPDVDVCEWCLDRYQTKYSQPYCSEDCRAQAEEFDGGWAA